LESKSELAPDVVFRVEEEEEVGHIPAHKFLLAGASPVFRAQFYGPAKEHTDQVVIHGTTVKAFTTMMRFLYMDPHPAEFSLKDTAACPQSLCELVNLAEKYQVVDLLEVAKAALRDLPVTEENLLFIATTAKNYAFFEDVSKILTSKCKAFLSSRLNTANDVYSLIAKTKQSFLEADMEFLCELLMNQHGRAERPYHWQTVFSLEEESHFEKETYLATLRSVMKEWRVSFTIKPDGPSAQDADRLPAWSNCLKLSHVMEVQLFTGQGSSSIFALGVKIHNWTENSPSTTTIPLEILQSTHAVIEIEFSKLGKSQLELKIFRDGALTGGERFHDDFVDESGDIEVYASDSNLPVSISDVIVQFLFR